MTGLFQKSVGQRAGSGFGGSPFLPSMGRGFAISRRSFAVPKPPRVLGGTTIVVFEAGGAGLLPTSRTAQDLFRRGQESGANPLCYPNVLAMETVEPSG
jgi:hypothetical protein